MNDIPVTKSKGGSYRMTEEDKQHLTEKASNNIIPFSEYVSGLKDILNPSLSCAGANGNQ